MKTPKGLGKGLRALISEAEVASDSAAPVTETAVELIDPNPFQPRQIFDDESIAELKESILQQGLLQPVVLRPHGDRFELIIGERRLRAAKAAGLRSIPAIVRRPTRDDEMLILALLENVQRKDLNPIELARGLQQLLESTGVTQEGLADKIGLSRAHVANTIRLLKLPPTMLDAVGQGHISAGHARALVAVTDLTERERLFRRFLGNDRLTVREAERLTRRPSTTGAREKGASPDQRRQALELARLEDLLQRRLSTRVKIKPRARGGVIEIQFFTAADLERLLELLDR